MLSYTLTTASGHRFIFSTKRSLVECANEMLKSADEILRRYPGTQAGEELQGSSNLLPDYSINSKALYGGIE